MHMQYREAMTQAGLVALEENPRLLVTVSGLGFATELRPARDAPIQIPRENLVYEAHDYSFHWSDNEDWGNYLPKEFTDYVAKLDERWGYLLRENIAPVWLSEFGMSNPYGQGEGSMEVRWWNHWARHVQNGGPLAGSGGLDWAFWQLWGVQSEGTNRERGGLEGYGVLNECGTDAREWLDEGSNIDAIQSVMAEPEPPFYLEQVGSSKCVHASGGPAGNGVPLKMLNGCFDKKNKLDKVSIGKQGESFHLRNHPQRSCIHVEDDRLVYRSTAKCIGSANAFKEVDAGNGSLYLQHLQSQKYVEIDDEFKLVLGSQTGVDSFRKIELSNIQLLADPTKCLGVFETESPFTVGVFDCSPGKGNQQFVVSSSTIRWTESEDLCFDVNGGSAHNGNNIILWDCHGNDNQHFEIRRGEIVWPKASNKCLVPEHTGNGAKLVVSDCSGLAFSAAR